MHVVAGALSSASSNYRIFRLMHTARYSEGTNVFRALRKSIAATVQPGNIKRLRDSIR
jgi:hypothetical protein